MLTTPRDVERLIITAAQEYEQVRAALKQIGCPGVAFLGSATPDASIPYLNLAFQCADYVASRGYPIIQGGGQALMAEFGRAASAYGLSVALPISGDKFGPGPTANLTLEFENFGPRLDAFAEFGSAAWCFLPGGAGTWHEFMYLLDNMSTSRIAMRPVLLVEPDDPCLHYWTRSLKFIQAELVSSGFIREDVMALIHLCRGLREFSINFDAVVDFGHSCSTDEGRGAREPLANGMDFKEGRKGA